MDRVERILNAGFQTSDYEISRATFDFVHAAVQQAKSSVAFPSKETLAAGSPVIVGAERSKQDEYCEDEYYYVIEAYRDLIRAANDPDGPAINATEASADKVRDVIANIGVLLNGYCADKLSTQEIGDLEDARDELIGLLGRWAAEGPDTTFVEFLQGNAELLNKIGATLANLGALFGFPLSGKNPLLQP